MYVSFMTISMKTLKPCPCTSDRSVTHWNEATNIFISHATNRGLRWNRNLCVPITGLTCSTCSRLTMRLSDRASGFSPNRFWWKPTSTCFAPEQTGRHPETFLGQRCSQGCPGQYDPPAHQGFIPGTGKRKRQHLQGDEFLALPGTTDRKYSNLRRNGRR